MKLFYAMLGTETNTFSPIPTGWGIWRDTTLRRRNAQTPSVSRKHAVYRPLFERLDARGWVLEPGLQAFAAPAGITPRPVYEALRDELLDDLQACAPVDAVMLFLHGAMVAEGYTDCEGDLLGRVRALVGAEVPVGAELDLHCHLTPAMLEAADALVGFKHYPHTDTFERLLDLFEILADAAEGRVRPTMASADCRMIGMYHTTRAPMTTFVDELYALERRDEVLNAWLAHGFPYGDVETIGTRSLVITDADPALAQELANGLRDRFYALRDEVQTRPLTMQQALAEALTSPGPVTIADTADNTGGGAPGDSTFFLRALLDGPPCTVALGPLYDPGAVNVCHDAGVGAQLKLRIGGKLSPDSGEPVDVTAEVLAVADRVTQVLNGGPSSLGACAGIRILRGTADSTADAFDVVLSSRRTQAGSPELFTKLAIDPTAKQLIVVKSTQHFHAGFAPISSRVLYTGDRGALQGRFTDIPYRHVATENYWPFSEQSW